MKNFTEPDQIAPLVHAGTMQMEPAAATADRGMLEVQPLDLQFFGAITKCPNSRQMIQVHRRHKAESPLPEPVTMPARQPASRLLPNVPSAAQWHPHIARRRPGRTTERSCSDKAMPWGGDNRASSLPLAGTRSIGSHCRF